MRMMNAGRKRIWLQCRSAHRKRRIREPIFLLHRPIEHWTESESLKVCLSAFILDIKSSFTKKSQLHESEEKGISGADRLCKKWRMALFVRLDMSNLPTIRTFALCARSLWMRSTNVWGARCRWGVGAIEAVTDDTLLFVASNSAVLVAFETR